MTLNDLINRLEQMNQNHTSIGWETLQFVAPLLRQQQAELDAFKLQYYNTGYSLQLRDKDETIKQQAQEIAMLKQIIDANNLQLNIGQLKKELALQRLSDFSQEIDAELKKASEK